MKKFLSILFVALLLSLTTGALANETVKIAASPVPHAEVLEFIKPLMAEKGFDIQIEIFEDYILPNTVVESGEVDANYFQHTSYLYTFNKENGTHLVPVIPVHFEPMGIFKGKSEAQSLTSIDDLQDGAKIGVPNDTSNEARALLLLESYGL
ncbi:MetQ/NlpA family ABC transporter substrate-binding protein, partial [Eubacteriales bacterium OttesenSCG-928-A19]|nr:MetQ/NlpA family ABC transporter substrate-binding protein [Eubacteriales bacterium OttesenSCG-928-A19]